MADKLKLPLSRSIADRKPSHKLPLPLNRTLGTVDNVDNGNNNKPPIEQGLANSAVVSCFDFSINQAVNIKHCHNYKKNSSHIANCYLTTREQAKIITNCYQSLVTNFVNLSACTSHLNSNLTAINQCFYHYYLALILLNNCDKQTVKNGIGYIRCNRQNQAEVKALIDCNQSLLQATTQYQYCLPTDIKGKFWAVCQTNTVQKAVPVPCRYYPIPPKPPIPPVPTCKIRPPSYCLPLPLKRVKTLRPSSCLPLPLQCWHDEPIIIIPNLPSYIMHNTLTTTIAGLSVGLLSFNIKTDMDSYCWQGSIEISPSDYQKIKHKLNAPRGNEPLINVMINNYQFAILAEEQSRNRQFVNNTYTLSGRSLSARLGADYAVANDKLYGLDSYASQLVRGQLEDLPITLAEFSVEDWFIPADSYSTTNKTPLAVINDVAEACGGFVVSHTNQASISIKKRWKVKAWEMATTTADVVLPVDVTKQISNTRQTNPLYNTVTLTSPQEIATIYRDGYGQDNPAPLIDNPLFTEGKCNEAKGIQILSDSGIHGDYQIILPFSEKYQIPLAKLGEIWQINDDTEGGDGAWRGVITAVNISVKVVDGVPIVWQTINVDRYEDG